MIENEFVRKIVKVITKEMGKTFLLDTKVGLVMNLRYLNTPCELTT